LIFVLSTCAQAFARVASFPSASGNRAAANNVVNCSSLSAAS